MILLLWKGRKGWIAGLQEIVGMVYGPDRIVYDIGLTNQCVSWGSGDKASVAERLGLVFAELSVFS